jgi:hypothetical protein
VGHGNISFVHQTVDSREAKHPDCFETASICDFTGMLYGRAFDNNTPFPDKNRNGFKGRLHGYRLITGLSAAGETVRRGGIAGIRPTR